MSADVLPSRPCLKNILNVHNGTRQTMAVKKSTINALLPTLQETTPRNTPSNTPRERRIYTREFLLKFKAIKSAFPPGESPTDLIEIYNKECLARDQRAAQALPAKVWAPIQEASSDAVDTVTEPAKSVTQAQSQESTSVETEPVKVFKLRIPSTSDKLVNRPLFSTPKKAARTPTTLKPTPTEDKENAAKSSQQTITFKKVKATTPLSTPSATKEQPKKSPANIELPSPKPSVADALVADPVNADQVETQGDGSTEELVNRLLSVLRETDPRRLEQRQKQIDYGKNTVGYQTYTATIPKNKRRRENPKTPNKNQSCSKRSWDGQIRKWRRSLHLYDPPGTVLEDDIMEDATMEDQSADSEIVRAIAQ